jgi:predicted ATPase
MSGPLILLTGCSGGGKSTLLAALSERGFATVEEPGRRVIRAGGPTPWEDLPGFLRACFDLAEADFARAAGYAGPVFFDRGMIDAASGLDALGEPVPAAPLSRCRYDAALLAPPWPELFGQDAERRHGWDAAVAEYDRLVRDLPRYGYAPRLLPRAPVAERADWVEAWLQDRAAP